MADPTTSGAYRAGDGTPMTATECEQTARRLLALADEAIKNEDYHRAIRLTDSADRWFEDARRNAPSGEAM